MDISASKIVAIPLDDLRASPLNARTIDKKSINELAASIQAEGLLQNLTVTEGADGLYEVVAGNRRLKALNLLRERGKLATELLSPPCRIVDLERAQSASLAENVVREAMHPADEFEAFKRLAEQGRSIEEIAQEFGVLPLIVQRRLRLANVAPSLFAKFRAGEIQLDQMMALAITENHAEQEAAWNVPGQYEREAARIRDRLTKKEINTARDKVCLFVGIDAMRAAGVIVRTDLFSDRGEGFIDDRLLVDQLALERLEIEAEKVRAAGWSFVEARIDFPYEQRSEFGRIYPDTSGVELSKSDQKQLTALRKEYEQLENSAMDVDAEESDEDALRDRMEIVEQQINDLEAKAEKWSPDQLKAAGAVVTIDSAGKLEIHPGLVAGGAKAARKVPGNIEFDRAERGGSVKTKAKTDLADPVVRRISAHRTAILQGALLDRPAIALVTLAHSLLITMLYADRREQRASMITFQSPGNLEELADELPLAGHFAGMSERIKAIGDPVPPATKLFAWLLQQPEATVHQLLAWCVAKSIDTVDRYGVNKDHQAIANDLATALGIDYANYWEPTREAFLSHVPRAVIEAAVKEVRGAAEVEKLSDLNKAGLVESAELLLAGKRWLPKFMRMKTPAPSPIEATKATAKAAKSKRAAKNASKSKAPPNAKAPTKKPAAKKAARKSKR